MNYFNESSFLSSSFPYFRLGARQIKAFNQQKYLRNGCKETLFDFPFVKMKVVVILLAAVFGRNFQFFQNRDNSRQNDTEKQNIFHPRAAGQRWLQRIGLQLGIFKTQLEGDVQEKSSQAVMTAILNSFMS